MTTTSPTINGLDTGALGGLVDMLKQHPEGGRVSFAAQSRWQDGARVLTRLAGYRIDGDEAHGEERRFVLLSDEPTELSGTDAAPAPVEQLMHALAGCIGATINARAAFAGVKLDRLDLTIEGGVDLHGIFGLEPRARPGVQGLTVTVDIAADAAPERLREIVAAGIGTSPIRDSVEHGVPIEAEVRIA